MPVKNDSTVILHQNVLLRVSRTNPSSQKLCLLLHGWNGDENSMQIFFSNLPEEYALIAPRAFYPTVEGGYTWAPSLTQWTRIPEKEPLALDELIQSSRRIYELLPQWIKFLDLNISEVALVGFSQGAALSLLLGFLSTSDFKRIACLSGFLPDGFENRLETTNIKNKDILIAHGTQDEIIPVEKARKMSKQLSEMGANVSYCEDKIGHKTSLSCRKKLESFFSVD